LLKEFGDAYHKVWDEAFTMRTPILLNSNNYVFNDEYGKTVSSPTYNNQGMLQDVCMNLPRFAYLSKDEEGFIEILKAKINLSSKILLKKHEIIRRRLESNHLPLFSGIVKNQNIYNLENQCLSISFIGLNEATKFITDYELHEHSNAFNFGKKILIEMIKVCKELSKNTSILHVLSENISENSPFRFAKLDLKHFPKAAIPQFNGKMYYYTNSAHFREDAEIDVVEKVKKQEIYHQFIQNGAIEYISLSELKKSNINLEDFVNRIFLPSKLVRLGFFS
jgi:ribonucleoside-triphosphate reductase